MSKTRFLALLAALLAPVPALALGAVDLEVGLGFAFDSTNYGNDNYTWRRKWGTNLGVHLSERSQIEVAYQSVIDRTNITGVEDTTYYDQIYSLNWVQSILGKKSPVQPYAKIGIGQLNREGTGSYAGGGSPPARVDSVTGVLGAGVRLYFTRTIGFRVEATTYLTGGRISTWQNNVGLTAGFSFFF